jgi:Reverse transcriptase (RNA-dependent DNA polymerase)/GAG-pre-integrase domain
MMHQVITAVSPSVQYIKMLVGPVFSSNRRRNRGLNQKYCNVRKKRSSRLYRLRQVKYVRRCYLLCSLLAYSNNSGTLAPGKHRQPVVEQVEKYRTDACSTMTNPSDQRICFDTDSVPIKIDNCSSRSMSFSRADFVTATLKPVYNTSVTGYSGSKTPITHKGTIRWFVADDNGQTQELVIPESFYVPTSSTRLLSPQHFAQQAKDHYPISRGTWCATYDDSICLQWKQRTCSITTKLDKESANVATIWTAAGYKKYQSFCSRISEPLAGPLSFEVNLDEDNEEKVESPTLNRDPSAIVLQDPVLTDFNLDGPVTDECKDCTSNSSLLDWHCRLSHLSFKRIQKMARRGQLPSELATCQIPTCQACMYGKMTKRPWRTRSTKEKEPLAIVNAPGDCVSVDQLESSVPGLIGQLKGKPTTKRYRVATVFVDHHSNFSYVHLQTSTNAQETLSAKIEFERYARSFGVAIKHYHADNGRFADNEWRDDVVSKGQRLSFCGVGAHHQNGRAEKRIRDIQDLARTSLIHANRRWPDAIDARLWPYALLNSNLTICKTPFPQQEESPYEIFSRSRVLPNLYDDHPFGCPVYILDGRLQVDGHITKWASRARLAIYLGHSSQHSQTVALVLSMTTGLVSPQFHVRFDDSFETIRHDRHQPKSNWQSACGFERPVLTKDKYDELQEVGCIPRTEHSEIHETIQPEIEDIGSSNPTDDITDTGVPSEGVDDTNESAIHPPEPPTTRSGRETRMPKHLDDFIVYHAAVQQEDCLETDHEYLHPLAMNASSDPDIMYLDKALKAPDRVEFVKAMEKEVRAHTESKNWRIIPRAKVPAHQTVLPAVWAMRRKRNIKTQEVYKWKARLNVHGGKQVKGLNYWETYAPVASWASIRLVMNLAAFRKWETRQLDFVLAFLQAPIETDIFMEIPAGFKVNRGSNDYVLHLVNNLYGQKQAGRVWNIFLSKGLEKLGFQQSKNDPCIFWRGKSMIIIYTDDTIVTGPDPIELDKVVKDIASAFEITSQPAVDDFLGVHVARDHDSGTITLTQPHLIKSIIDDLGLKENSKSRSIPALSTKILRKHETSPPHNEDWHYRSIIGKLNYLEKSSRPDLAYAVHQCARFCENPRVEHTKAVKLIGRYLLGTADKGLICTPDESSFNCYCDADFCGLWDPGTAEMDPSTARSRSGYVVKYANCPVIWASKLQTEIALSSTESEYVSLSQSLREVIPLMRLVQELADAGFSMSTTTPKVHCRVFEDNSGALAMAQSPKMRPRTRHMNLKYHHFREAVSRGYISIHAINTLEQVADILTKPLAEMQFKKLRKMMMGW